jgi:amino acid adenylation domain-containing protein
MSDKKIEAAYPLSPTQQGMLFHALYAPKSRAYFSQISCVFKDALDSEAFERAWQRSVERHGVLRTAFVWEEVEQPLQVVGRRVRMPLKQLDWRGLPFEEQRERLRAYLEEDRARGFQLSKAPVMRLSIIRTDERLYHLVWSFHHLLLDGWSQALVLKEVFALYEAERRGVEIKLDEARPYRDYIRWLKGQDMGRAEAFWRERLRGLIAPTPLGGERAPHASHADAEEFAQQQIKLSAQTTADLRAFARRQQLTLNTVIQGAWALLLSRYSGEADVMFGAVVAGRPAALAGVESMVGLFINTLPVRVRIDADARVGEWLRKLQREQTEMRQYEYSPLVQVQGWSEVPRGLPLFESILDFENYPMDRAVGEWGANLELSDTGFTARTNYPLEVVAVPGTEFSLQMKYDASRFDDATIKRVLGHFEALLTGVAAGPERRIAELPWLTRAEEHQLLVEWNETEADYPRRQVAHQLFEAQAERTPDDVAVVFADESLTYRELNERANRLAWALMEKGAGREVLVALMLERGVEFLTCLLAVFKVGAAYVPLDPFHPVARIRQSLEQSRSALVLTTAEFTSTCAQALEGFAGRERPAILHFEELLGGERRAENLKVAVSPGNLAYVIFTSGSTGQPKGAMIEHGGMLNHLYAKISDLRLTSRDVVGQTASQCFDISVWQFLAPLLAGGRVHIFGDEVIHEPARFFAEAGRGALTILETVPSLLRATLEELSNSRPVRRELPALRWLILTGETLPPELCHQWFEVYPEIPLLNAYGPTECSDDVTHYALTSPPLADLVRVPIGRPVANTRLYILDSALQAVAVGVKGELYVGGDGVGRGYANEPARTAAVFIPDPLGQTGTRLYKTGDLARFLPCGNIEFLGRSDSQVKVRGFRIEPGELESALCQHPGVREAVALALANETGANRLVAYVVAHGEQAPTVSELRTFLKRSLPDYMIPEALVMLPAFPLTSNGKLNLRALPPPDARRPEQSALLLRPRTPVEERLAGLWKEVLQVEQVGVHDNFFDLGGHSLVATKLVTRIRNEFSVELSLADFFAAATVEKLAERVEEALFEQTGSATIDELLEMLEAVDEREAESLLTHDNAPDAA